MLSRLWSLGRVLIWLSRIRLAIWTIHACVTQKNKGSRTVTRSRSVDRGVRGRDETRFKSSGSDVPLKVVMKNGKRKCVEIMGKEEEACLLMEGPAVGLGRRQGMPDIGVGLADDVKKETVSLQPHMGLKFTESAWTLSVSNYFQMCTTKNPYIAGFGLGTTRRSAWRSAWRRTTRITRWRSTTTGSLCCGHLGSEL